MKTCEWTPKRRSRALGLIEGGRHKLREISQITNIARNLKKRNTLDQNKKHSALQTL